MGLNLKKQTLKTEVGHPVYVNNQIYMISFYLLFNLNFSLKPNIILVIINRDFKIKYLHLYVITGKNTDRFYVALNPHPIL